MNSKLAFFAAITALLLLSSCQKQSAGKPRAIKNFPPEMVGTWSCQIGPSDAQLWEITFEKGGVISKLHHPVFGSVIVSEGGIYKDGPDPNTYMVMGLGPIETDYSAASNTIKLTITIDDYEMKLPAGTLKGRMIDKFSGTASSDGKTWRAEWRSYGWLEGAAEPPIDIIDANPQIVPFQKFTPSDPNRKG